MPSAEELGSFVPPIVHCHCGVPACYTTDEYKIRTKGEMGCWGFVCGHTKGPAPFFVSLLFDILDRKCFSASVTKQPVNFLQEGARCASKCWLESEKQYELYWFGAGYVERKEKKMLEEKQKKEHRAKYQKQFEEWCAKKKATKVSASEFD